MAKASTQAAARPRRRDEYAAATRDALVDAGRELFGERGYSAVGTEEIVARARVTRGALYHHFTDKGDLFRAVHDGSRRTWSRGRGEDQGVTDTGR